MNESFTTSNDSLTDVDIDTPLSPQHKLTVDTSKQKCDYELTKDIFKCLYVIFSIFGTLTILVVVFYFGLKDTKKK